MVHEVQVLQLEGIEVGGNAVTEQVHLGLEPVAGEVLCELDGVKQPRRGVGCLRLAKRTTQHRLGTGRRLAHLRHPPGQDEHHLVAVVHPVDQLANFNLRLAKPVGRHIGRLHRGRYIQHHHEKPATLHLAGEVRACECEHRQRQQDQLDDQQPVVPEFLKRGVGLCLVEKSLPQHRARNQPCHATALEQIKHHHHRQGHGERQCFRREKIHRHMPPVRMALSSRSSIGVSDCANW